jgi:hypothetical protein
VAEVGAVVSAAASAGVASRVRAAMRESRRTVMDGGLRKIMG